MSLADVVTVAITSQTTSVTKPGYGTPLVAAYHTLYTDRVRSYTSPAGVASDGFAITSPAYKAVSTAFAQNPSVKRVKLGRRALPPTQTVKLQMLSSTQGDHVRVTVNATAIDYTILASATTSTVATAVAALIDADAVAVASATTDTITITTGSAGVYIDVLGWSSNVAVSETTTDPGIATDLAAIQAADNDWYGLALDNNSKAEVVAAAAWAEANGKLFGYNTSDSAVYNPGSTTDVMYLLKNSAYRKTYGFYSGSQLRSFSGLAAMANRFPGDPGSDTWEFKTLAGIPADTLTDSQEAAIWAKNGNTYQTLQGVNITQHGKVASGEWIDVIRFIDWLTTQIAINVFSAQVNSQKIPFTDAGVDQIGLLVESALKAGVRAGGLSSNPAPVVITPKVADIAQQDKVNRNLAGVTFNATLAGAISTTAISGTVTA